MAAVSGLALLNIYERRITNSANPTAEIDRCLAEIAALESREELSPSDAAALRGRVTAFRKDQSWGWSSVALAVAGVAGAALAALAFLRSGASVAASSGHVAARAHPVIHTLSRVPGAIRTINQLRGLFFGSPSTAPRPYMLAFEANSRGLSGATVFRTADRMPSEGVGRGDMACVPVPVPFELAPAITVPPPMFTPPAPLMPRLPDLHDALKEAERFLDHPPHRHEDHDGHGTEWGAGGSGGTDRYEGNINPSDRG